MAKIVVYRNGGELVVKKIAVGPSAPPIIPTELAPLFIEICNKEDDKRGSRKGAVPQIKAIIPHIIVEIFIIFKIILFLIYLPPLNFP